MKFIICVIENVLLPFASTNILVQSGIYKKKYNTCFVPLGNKKNVQYRSVISDIFDGKILSSVQCLTCERVRKGILAHDLDHC